MIVNKSKFRQLSRRRQRQQHAYLIRSDGYVNCLPSSPRLSQLPQKMDEDWAFSSWITRPGQVVQMSNPSSAYVKIVKEFFEAKNNNKYDVFLKIMKDLKAQRVDTDGVILRVKELFLEKSPVTFEDAFDFVNKIKARFNDNVYRAFLDIFNIYQKKIKYTTEVYQEVLILFQDHAGLLVDFILNGDGRVSPMAIEWYAHVENVVSLQ